MTNYTPRRLFMLALFFAIAFITWKLINSEVTGIDESPEMANSRIHHSFNIPATASKVRYISNVWSSRINVWISETDFLDWAKRKGWALKKIAPESPSFFLLIETIDTAEDLKYVPIHTGWKFIEGEDVYFEGRFDRTHGVATLTFGSR